MFGSGPCLRKEYQKSSLVGTTIELESKGQRFWYSVCKVKSSVGQTPWKNTLGIVWLFVVPVYVWTVPFPYRSPRVSTSEVPIRPLSNESSIWSFPERSGSPLIYTILVFGREPFDPSRVWWTQEKLTRSNRVEHLPLVPFDWVGHHPFVGRSLVGRGRPPIPVPPSPESLILVRVSSQLGEITLKIKKRIYDWNFQT